MARISAKITEKSLIYRLRRINSTEGRNGLEQIPPFAGRQKGEIERDELVCSNRIIKKMADLPNSMDPKECGGGGNKKNPMGDVHWVWEIGCCFWFFSNAETRFNRVKIGVYLG